MSVLHGISGCGSADVGAGIDLSLFLWTGGPDRVRIANNIFFSAGVGRNSSGVRRNEDGTHVTEPGFGQATRVVFERNLLFGNFRDLPSDWRKMTSDPMLASPGTGREGLASLAGYMLRPGSPCLGAGIPIAGNGGRDFWGNPVALPPAIGVHERTRN
ncbi:MAG: hypothetical protein DMG07_23765 [Acidobacteria bacterium]|nr:MAG: hypothetical protein DMG07_23765 [Acidobacteriota bacterium]